MIKEPMIYYFLNNSFIRSFDLCDNDKQSDTSLNISGINIKENPHPGDVVQPQTLIFLHIF